MEKKKKQKQKLSWKKWLLVGVGAVILLVGGKYLLMRKQIGDRSRAFEVQREVMIDYWKEQGLSDEEIAEKMIEERSMTGERPEGMERPASSSFLRMVGGGRGLH